MSPALDVPMILKKTILAANEGMDERRNGRLGGLGVSRYSGLFAQGN
jgi:hypothetical protein